MSEQNPSQKQCACCSKPWLRKLGLGALFLAIPAALWGLYRQLEKTADEKNRKQEKGYDYDTTALRQIDPSLIRYKEVMSFSAGIASPLAVSADHNGDIIVAGDNIIKRFTSTGMPTGNIDISGSPTALATHADGTIYVGLKDHVEVFNKDGKRLATWQSLGSAAHIACIAVSADDVYVADGGSLNGLVHRYGRDGTSRGELGRADPAQNYPGLRTPSPHLDVSLAADGTVWIANPGNRRIEAWSPNGTLGKYWGEAGTAIQAFPGCCNPADFVMLADGSFITAEKGVARIKRYLGDGRFDCVVAAPDKFGDNMKGVDLAVDAQNRVIAMERGTQLVRVFAPIDGEIR